MQNQIIDKTNMTNNASEYLIVKQRHNIYHLSQPEGLPAPSAPEGHLKHHTIQLIEASSPGL